MSGKEAPARPTLQRVGVRALCEFTAKAGDLDLRFTPAPSADEGIHGHRVVTGRRGAGYESEVRLESRHGALLLQGRADGLKARPWMLEEIKTHRGDVHRIPDNHQSLHWAQLKVYGAQLCRKEGLDHLTLALTYFNVDTEEETTLTEPWSAEALDAFHDEQARRYSEWAMREALHRTARNAALQAVAFPYPELHPGQRQLAEATYRTVRKGGVLLAQAPTGIGKSLGTLFPALKAMGKGGLEKIFYLTAKTSGRRMALDAIDALGHEGRPIPLRVLELVARDKSCEHPGKACHGDDCPLAKGFYDRLPAAREDVLKQPRLDHRYVRNVASVHRVCPYYLAQDLVRWADVVVGDYNYYFDQSALLHALTVDQEWRVAVLVDEAHNLVERGRGMYSASLDPDAIGALVVIAPDPLKPSLKRLQRLWLSLRQAMLGHYTVLDAPPQAFIDCLRGLAGELADYFIDHPANTKPDLQRLYFDVLGMLALAESFGPHSLFDLQVADGDFGEFLDVPPRPTIRNVIPGAFLAQRYAAARATIAFSATLVPEPYYRDLLGIPKSARWLDVPSPFTPDQLEVRVASHISTRYRHRRKSIQPIIDLMAAQYRARPGNYLAFFSSFDYLQQVRTPFREQHPDIPAYCQSPKMSEENRDLFLNSFKADSAHIAFVVLGGLFGEGVDLVGDRLIGAFITTLGMPQVNPVNDALLERMEAVFGKDTGRDYIYLFPGIQKVIQAAGRVIRTPADRGILHLIDDRYDTAEIRALMPGWWG